MIEIVPSIIGKDFEEIKTHVAAVVAQTKWIQIDVDDGQFAPQKTWPYTEGGLSRAPRQLRFLRTLFPLLKIELHLMTARPEREIALWQECAPDRILVHYEATEKLKALLTIRKPEIGVALKLATPVEALLPFLTNVRTTQLMSIERIGAYGEPFDERVIPKIVALRAMMPRGTISVDGGVTPEHLDALERAGADALIVGSHFERVLNAISTRKQNQIS